MDGPVNKTKYCALGDYGIEYTANSLEECQKWIDEQVVDGETEPDYYAIVTYTQAQLDALPEV